MTPAEHARRVMVLWTAMQEDEELAAAMREALRLHDQLRAAGDALRDGRDPA